MRQRKAQVDRDAGGRTASHIPVRPSPYLLTMTVQEITTWIAAIAVWGFFVVRALVELVAWVVVMVRAGDRATGRARRWSRD